MEEEASDPALRFRPPPVVRLRLPPPRELIRSVLVCVGLCLAPALLPLLSKMSGGEDCWYGLYPSVKFGRWGGGAVHSFSGAQMMSVTTRRLLYCISLQPFGLETGNRFTFMSECSLPSLSPSTYSFTSLTAAPCTLRRTQNQRLPIIPDTPGQQQHGCIERWSLPPPRSTGPSTDRSTPRC